MAWKEGLEIHFALGVVVKEIRWGFHSIILTSSIKCLLLVPPECTADFLALFPFCNMHNGEKGNKSAINASISFFKAHFLLFYGSAKIHRKKEQILDFLLYHSNFISVCLHI